MLFRFIAKHSWSTFTEQYLSNWCDDFKETDKIQWKQKFIVWRQDKKKTARTGQIKTQWMFFIFVKRTKIPRQKIVFFFRCLLISVKNTYQRILTMIQDVNTAFYTRTATSISFTIQLFRINLIRNDKMRQWWRCRSR